MQSSFESIGNCATVGSYYRCLAAAALVPDLDSVNDAFVRAVQNIVNDIFALQSLLYVGAQRPIESMWNTFVCSHLQHEGWDEFAASQVADENRDIIGIDFGHLVSALTEVAVADEDSINEVGHWNVLGPSTLFMRTRDSLLGCWG